MSSSILSEGKHIIDFSAYSFCIPCRRIKPVYEELEKKYNTINFITVETDKEYETDDYQKLIDKYQVESVPTFVFIKDGETIEQFSGANEKRLREATQKLNDL